MPVAGAWHDDRAEWLQRPRLPGPPVVLFDVEGDALEHYVTALLAGWADAASRSDQPVVWAVDHGPDDITWLMRHAIAEPVFAKLAADPGFRGTVTDPQGALVPNLTREDFEILDNNAPQELVVFENQTQPITAIVMLDSSGSMTNSLKLVYAGAEQFIIRLLPQDKAQVGAFNDKVEFSGSFTSDRDELVAALRDLDFGKDETGEWVGRALVRPVGTVDHSALPGRLHADILLKTREWNVIDLRDPLSCPGLAVRAKAATPAR